MCLLTKCSGVYRVGMTRLHANTSLGRCPKLCTLSVSSHSVATSAQNMVGVKHLLNDQMDVQGKP